MTKTPRLIIFSIIIAMTVRCHIPNNDEIILSYTSIIIKYMILFKSNLRRFLCIETVPRDIFKIIV